MKQTPVRETVIRNVLKTLRTKSMDTTPVASRWSGGVIFFNDLQEISELISYLQYPSKRSEWVRKLLRKLDVLLNQCHAENCQNEQYMYRGCQEHWQDFTPQNWVDPFELYKTLIRLEKYETVKNHGVW